jgi:hypothetical protein
MRVMFMPRQQIPVQQMLKQFTFAQGDMLFYEDTRSLENMKHVMFMHLQHYIVHNILKHYFSLRGTWYSNSAICFSPYHVLRKIPIESPKL